ncbi:MAG: class B sortase [Clostridiales bacterium]|nr:class B sortase [Clostridiales bacterium]
MIFYYIGIIKKKEKKDQIEKKFQYQELKEKNEDSIGWITIEDTRIDYPVMYRKGDNQFYLNHNFQKEYSITGTPFIDGAWNPKSRKDNLIVYAHHMKDGSMFADLMKYEDVKYYEKHKQIAFYIKNKKYTYEIFAVCRVSAENEQGFYDIKQLESKQYEFYLEKIKEKAIYITDSYPKKQEQLLLLSTCEYSQEDGRLIVLAKKR